MADLVEEMTTAIREGNLKHLESLLKTASTDSVNRVAKSIGLHNASCLGLLLDYIPDIDFTGHSVYYKTLLMEAAGEGNVDCVRQLLDRGANVNVSNIQGNTALMYACDNNHAEVFDLLVERGADIHASGSMGNAVMHTVEKNAFDCLHKLLELGGKIQDDNIPSKTVLIHAILFHHLEFANVVLDHIECKNNEEERKKYIDTKDHEGKTALMCSCERDNPQIIGKLLNLGADINARDSDGRTAIMHAARNNNFENFKLFFDAGADLVISDNLGCTVFSSAVLGDGEILEFLIDKGNVLSNNGALKFHHKHGFLKAMAEEEFFSCNVKTVAVTMKYGIFDWNWIGPNNRDPLSTFVTAALQSGYSPGTFKYKDFNISVLPWAFINFDVPTIKFLLAHRYFLPEDYTLLSTDKTFRNEIKYNPAIALSEAKDQVHEILNQLTLQPLSLQTWSFINISKGISMSGPPNKWKNRVDSLSLPEVMKKALHFDSDITQMCYFGMENISQEEAFDSLNFVKEITRDEDELACDSDSCFQCTGDWDEFRGNIMNSWW